MDDSRASYGLVSLQGPGPWPAAGAQPEDHLLPCSHCCPIQYQQHIYLSFQASSSSTGKAGLPFMLPRPSPGPSGMQDEAGGQVKSLRGQGRHRPHSLPSPPHWPGPGPQSGRRAWPKPQSPPAALTSSWWPSPSLPPNLSDPPIGAGSRSHLHCSLTLEPNRLLSGCFCRPRLSSQVASRAQQAWLSCHCAMYPAQSWALGRGLG